MAYKLTSVSNKTNSNKQWQHRQKVSQGQSESYFRYNITCQWTQEKPGFFGSVTYWFIQNLVYSNMRNLTLSSKSTRAYSKYSSVLNKPSLLLFLLSCIHFLKSQNHLCLTIQNHYEDIANLCSASMATHYPFSIFTLWAYPQRSFWSCACTCIHMLGYAAHQKGNMSEHASTSITRTASPQSFSIS